MAKARSLVGLDVHAAKIVAAVLDADTGELEVFVMGGENTNASAFCAGLPQPVRVAYEAGPTGYTLAREGEERSARPLRPWSGCCSPGSPMRSASQDRRRKRCAISCARASRCGWI